MKSRIIAKYQEILFAAIRLILIVFECNLFLHQISCSTYVGFMKIIQIDSVDFTDRTFLFTEING